VTFGFGICSVTSVSSTCTSTCVSDVDCIGTNTIQLCTTSADCGADSGNSCCQIPDSSFNESGCIPTSTATTFNLTCD
jgi:hypothetical protein